MTKLSSYKTVDSCGSFMNNQGGVLAPEDNSEYGDQYFPFLQQFKFQLCFENTCNTNYMTEKLLNAYVAGCVPIYWGTPQVLEWLNPKAFLYLEDSSEAAMDALVEKIKQVDSDPALYAAYFREPLLKGPVPAALDLVHIRNQIHHCLARNRPDLYST